MTRRVVPLAALAIVLAASPATAATPEESALAEELFRSAKIAMDEQRWDDACPKLVESQRLDPAGGTVLTLALCHEAQGKLASAWVELGEAIAFAKRDGRANREAIARERRAALEPRLIRLRVDVAPATRTIPDVVLRRDGVEVKAAAWDVAAPVDPGPHVVEVSAPGYDTRRATVDVTAEGSIAVLAVPELVRRAGSPEPAPAAAFAPTPDPAPPRPRPLRFASYGVAGLAVAAAGAGAYFALDAKSKRDSANELCPQTVCTNPDGVDRSRDAGRSADVASVLLGSGAALAIGAVVLWLVSGDERPRAAPAASAR